MAEPTISETIQAGDDLLADKEEKSTTLQAANENKKKTSSEGFLSNTATKTTNTNTLESLKNNPIINMGLDTANQAVTGLSQSLVAGVTDIATKATAPFQAVVNDFFSGLATLSTISVEIGMELARNAGRALLKELDQKDKILADLETELVALHNACMIVANAQPFLTSYVPTLIDAYNAVRSARSTFDSVRVTLRRAKRFNKRSFDRGLQSLETAKNLILPDPTARVNIRNTGDFISATVTRPSNKEALAAALSIPGMTLKVGDLLVKYAAKTYEINTLILNFMGALDQFIAAYKRSDLVDNAVGRHIDSGITQMDKLIAEMQLLLFPTDKVASSVLYGPTVTTSATFWGLKVTTILEWMKFTPTKALEQMDITGESVRRYQQSVALLRAMGDQTYPGGVNKVTEGQEDGIHTVTVISAALVLANTVIARGVPVAEVRATLLRARNHVKAMKRTSDEIRQAVDPFVKTPFATIGQAKAIVGAILDFANKLGLDRIVRLINVGAVASLFNATADTATFAGNLVAGLNGVIKKSESDPNISQQDIERVTAVRDEVAREQTTKAIEAQRSAASTADLAIEQEDDKIQKTRDTVNTGKAAAQRVDTQGTATPSLPDVAKERVSDIVPNFNANLA